MKAEILSDCKLVLIPESKHESLLLDFFMGAYEETAAAPIFDLESMEAWNESSELCSYYYDPPPGQGRAYLVKREVTS